MKKEYSSGAGWNSASTSGLVMGLATIALALLQGLAGKTSGIGGGVLSIATMFVKIVACVMLFRWLMVRFHDEYDGIDHGRLVKFGLKVALFSALVVSAYSLLEMLVIKPEAYAEATAQIRETYSSFMDSNSLNAFDAIQGKMPLITFVTSIVYCFLWGWVLTSIFAKSIEPEDPFAGMTGWNGTQGKADDSGEATSDEGETNE